MIKVLFVCLGNICRSPTAEGVMQHKLNQRGWNKRFMIDSAGTAAYHIDKAPDPRSIQAARSRGISLSHLRARQVCAADYAQFDYILAMDKHNYSHLCALKPAGTKAQVALMLSYGDRGYSEVPDPYYGDGDGFEQVLDLLDNAIEGFLQQLDIDR